jgi:hypothetical protein
MAFDLSSITSGRSTRKPRTVIYGDSGLGKTTFGAGAPNPIFIQTEDGEGKLEFPRFPLSKSFDEVMGAIATLYTEDHPYQTVVIDTIDWLEPLIWEATCADAGKKSIEDFGFGKGYIEALNLWRQFFDGVTALRNDRDMYVVLLAHSQIVRIEDPMVAAYDSHTLKLHKRAMALVEEFSDVIGFACLKTMTLEEKKASFSDKDAKRTRAKTTGERQLHVSPSPAFTAKNRFDLPPVMSLDWPTYQFYLDTPAPEQAAAGVPLPSTPA